MHIRLSITIALGSLLLPGAGFAMESFSYDFTEGAVNAAWATGGPIEVTRYNEGVLLKVGTETGVFLTTEEPSFLAEGVEITATSSDVQSLRFGWILDHDTRKQTFDVPFSVHGEKNERVSLSLTHHEAWIRGGKKLGLVLPPGSAILLQKIEIQKWNVFEKAWNGLLSFWTFDSYRPYSINFIWGPQITFTPLDRAAIYEHLPPLAVSGTFSAYILLILVIVLIVIFCLRKPNKIGRIAPKILAVFAVAWLIFDLRMSSEFLSWVWKDQKTFIRKPVSVREFRERGQFYDFAAFAAPLVKDRETYLFFAEQQWPYLGNMRYLTYPAIPGNDLYNDDTWVIYNRPDFGIGADGRLVLDHESITEPGELLGEFAQGSFVFRGKRIPPTAQ